MFAALLGAVSLGASLSGCNEEVGCTNRRADNYNADAVRDDGTCINARDKFLGVYDALHICWPDTLKVNPNFMTIAEDNLRTDEKDDVKIINFGANGITVRALISRQVLTIPRQDLSVGGQPLTFRGEGHMDDTGYLSIIYSAWLPSGQSVYKDCVIFCTPVD
jgi:hypothetical protein